MSGISLAVGSRPGQRPGHPEHQQTAAHHESKSGLMGSLRTIQLQLIAFIVVFSASGLVPLFDLAYTVLVTAYVLILSRFIFPIHGSNMEGTESQMEVFHGSRMFQLYKAIGIVSGLFLPLAYVLGAFARGDQRAVKAATPHLFLLSVQVLSESVIKELAIFSPPVRVILTLLYSTRRIFTLCDWTSEEFSATSLPTQSRLKDVLWICFGRWLAVANFAYFTVNMFCFLIPRFLPRAFERYLAAKGSSYIGNSPVIPSKDPKGKEKEHEKEKRQ